MAGQWPCGDCGNDASSDMPALRAVAPGLPGGFSGRRRGRGNHGAEKSPIIVAVSPPRLVGRAAANYRFDYMATKLRLTVPLQSFNK
jgi:hypothetical protein